MFREERLKPPRNLALLALLGSLSLAAADPQSAPPPSPITLEAAVHYAAVHFPEARAALAKVVGARAAVGLARTAYLPRTDLLWQTNRATYNNIAGLLLPQSVIPPDEVAFGLESATNVLKDKDVTRACQFVG
jgi:hypothetical protein